MNIEIHKVSIKHDISYGKYNHDVIMQIDLSEELNIDERIWPIIKQIGLNHNIQLKHHDNQTLIASYTQQQTQQTHVVVHKQFISLLKDLKYVINLLSSFEYKSSLYELVLNSIIQLIPLLYFNSSFIDRLSLTLHKLLLWFNVRVVW